MMLLQFMPLQTDTAYAAGSDLTNKVTIDKITAKAKPNGATEKKDIKIDSSTNSSDYDYTLRFSSDVDYTFDFTVNKGTPFQKGDNVNIPINADYGSLSPTHGLEIRDSLDGSVIGIMDIKNNNKGGSIVITFTDVKASKTAAKVHVDFTLQYVFSIIKEFETNEERDAAEKSTPAGVDKIKILDKDANVNVQAYYKLLRNFVPMDSVPNSVEAGTKALDPKPSKEGYTAGDNAVVWSARPMADGKWRSMQTYVTDKDGNKLKRNVRTGSFASVAWIMGEDYAFANLPKGKNTYVEDTFPGNIYDKVYVETFGEIGVNLYDEGDKTSKPYILQSQLFPLSDPKCDFSVEVKGTGFYEPVYINKWQPKQQTTGQSNEDFKKSLGVGEYGFYKDANGDFKFVMNYGDLGSKDPSKMLTWGKLCDIFGKEATINRFFPRCQVEDNKLKETNSPESVEVVYNKIKNWPAASFLVQVGTHTIKPIRQNGKEYTNTAKVMEQDVTAKTKFKTNDASLRTHLDGMTIVKSDAKTGFGIPHVDFGLQEKVGGSWQKAGLTYVTIDGAGTIDKDNDMLYTDDNGLLKIRGLTSGHTYRLIERKPAVGYKNTGVHTNEAVINFAPPKNKDDYNGFEQTDITNPKADYKVTYKVVKNPKGEAIPA